ncbi:hypothetical protein L3Q82_010953, partial [Scortum barcoo]
KLEQQWPIMEKKDGHYLLYLSKFFKNVKVTLYVLQGKTCKDRVHNLTDHNVSDKSIINMTMTNGLCLNCDNPVKPIGEKLPKDYLNKKLGEITPTGGEIKAPEAAAVMNRMATLATAINGSSASLDLGEGVTGAIVKETEPLTVEEISLAYRSPSDEMNIIESRDKLASYSRSVTVTKEAFEQAVKLNVSVPFAAVLRFTNMTKDEKKSTVLGNEVFAVEMGATIMNLTDKIDISLRNISYSPLNETISSSDLKNLTIITQVGCGLSMFFLSVVLFMHFLLRKTKPSKATKILIHLVFAMFPAKLHLLDQQLRGQYEELLLPSIVGIVLLSTGKYGEQVIQTGTTEGNVAMCWITDSDVHYIVNIGYYVLVFLFTFTTFIIILSWLFCLRKTKTATAKTNTGGKKIVTILGLCCVLGVTWGFAFFAYGVLRIPSYYIFTVLNSFQGFFLFIYYYNTSHSGEINGGGNALKNLNSSSSSSSTLKTTVDNFANPYSNQPDKINTSNTKEK